MRYVLLAALILVADSNKMPPIIDNGKLTCRDFTCAVSWDCRPAT
jgi:hypothetical protein